MLFIHIRQTNEVISMKLAMPSLVPISHPVHGTKSFFRRLAENDGLLTILFFFLGNVSLHPPTKRPKLIIRPAPAVDTRSMPIGRTEQPLEGRREGTSPESQPLGKARRDGAGATDVANKMLRGARSVMALVEASRGLIAPVEDGTALVCTICTRGNRRSALSAIRAATIPCETGLDTAIGAQEPLPAAFRVVRRRVMQHLRSFGHRARLTRQLQPRAEVQRAPWTGGASDLNVLRTAYLVIRESGLPESFARWMLAQSLGGADVGSVERAGTLLPAARRALHAATIDRLREHVAGQPCVALLRDRLPVGGRSADLVALLTVVPHAPTGHLVQSLVLSATLVTEASIGARVAGHIQWALGTVGINSADQLAAIAAGDEHRRLAVPGALLHALGGSGKSTPVVSLGARASRSTVSRALLRAWGQPAGRWARIDQRAAARISNHILSYEGRRWLDKATAKSERQEPVAVEPWPESADAAALTAALRALLDNWRVIVTAYEMWATRQQGKPTRQDVRRLAGEYIE